jgi:A nuclease family of the HNH/ENDO VII superfamily with conserved AHH
MSAGHIRLGVATASRCRHRPPDAHAAQVCVPPGVLRDPRVAAGLAAVSAALGAIAKACIDRGGCPNRDDLRRQRKSDELHHIVAKYARMAAEGRRILGLVRIGIDSHENTVLLPTSFHRRVHTSAYYAAVNRTLYWAYEDAPSDFDHRFNDVFDALYYIKATLKLAAAAAR